VARQGDSRQIEHEVRDPMANWAAVLAARERPMSERLELALSWNSAAAELRAGMASVKADDRNRRPVSAARTD
jgi:hypothetical protein